MEENVWTIFIFHYHVKPPETSLKMIVSIKTDENFLHLYNVCILGRKRQLVFRLFLTVGKVGVPFRLTEI